jgi:peptidyl-prolyl cis-trans isomerase SurA
MPKHFVFTQRHFKFAQCAAFMMSAWIAGFSSVTWAQRSTEPLDDIVVVVNKQAISSLDLRRRERFLTAQLRRANQPLPASQDLYNAVLERAVIEALMLQQANTLGLTPSDEQVQQAIADNALQSGLDLQQFLSRVEQSGVSVAEYTQDLKSDMAINNAREKAMASKVKVTEADIDRFLKDPQSGIKQEYSVQALFIAKTEGASSQASQERRAQAASLLATAQAATGRAAFVALQSTVANPLDAAKHVVELPYSTLDKLPELYSNALENMSNGETSGILESSAGFYILRLSAKRSVLPQVQQTRARHILLSVPSANEEATVLEQVKRLHDRLTLNIDLFAALAKQYSQDGSAAKGGELGWALPGDMVPEFERTMDALNVGDMALPVRSQFGWHIVQVLERKTAEMPVDRMRARARNVLRLRKQDEAMNDWVDQLKAQAYIEYKLNNKR